MKQVRALGLMFAVVVACAFPARGEVGDMSAAWAELEKSEPDASRALLTLSTSPAQTIAFLRNKLVPVKLNEDEVRELLISLDSNDEAVWKSAFEQFRYLDPRLAMDLPKLMEEPMGAEGKTRLVAVLCDAPAEMYAGQNVMLRKTSNDGDYNFTADNGSWWAEHKVSRLNTGYPTSKAAWTRVARAIALLEHFATPESKAILQDLTTGHPDAQPTKLAQAALDRMSLVNP